MRKVFFIILIFSFFFSDDYIFSENIRITESSNDQKIPEISINENIIYLTWVSINGGSKNIMYSKSNNYGETFSTPIQVNYLDNNIRIEIEEKLNKELIKLNYLKKIV